MDINFQQYLKDPELTRLEGEATGAAQRASQYSSASSTLPFKLREAVMTKLNYNKDLIESQNKALAEYISAPSVAREKYQDVFNPFQREKLVTQERAQAYEPYANLTDILGARMGTIGDIVGAGTAGWQAQTQAAQGEAELASSRYTNKFSQLQAMLNAAIAEDTAKRGWAQEGRLGTESGGLGLGIDENGQITIDGKPVGGTTSASAQPSEPKPNYSPVTGAGTLSLKGEWVFTGYDWEPRYELVGD